MNIFPERVWFRTSLGFASRAVEPEDRERRREMEKAFLSRDPDEKRNHFDRAGAILEKQSWWGTAEHDWRGPMFVIDDD